MSVSVPVPLPVPVLSALKYGKYWPFLSTREMALLLFFCMTLLFVVSHFAEGSATAPISASEWCQPVFQMLRASQQANHRQNLVIVPGSGMGDFSHTVYSGLVKAVERRMRFWVLGTAMPCMHDCFALHTLDGVSFAVNRTTAVAGVDGDAFGRAIAYAEALRWRDARMRPPTYRVFSGNSTRHNPESLGCVEVISAWEKGWSSKLKYACNWTFIKCGNWLDRVGTQWLSQRIFHSTTPKSLDLTWSCGTRFAVGEVVDTSAQEVLGEIQRPGGGRSLIAIHIRASRVAGTYSSDDIGMEWNSTRHMPWDFSWFDAYAHAARLIEKAEPTRAWQWLIFCDDPYAKDVLTRRWRGRIAQSAPSRVPVHFRSNCSDGHAAIAKDWLTIALSYGIVQGKSGFPASASLWGTMPHLFATVRLTNNSAPQIDLQGSHHSPQALAVSPKRPKSHPHSTKANQKSQTKKKKT